MVAIEMARRKSPPRPLSSIDQMRMGILEEAVGHHLHRASAVSFAAFKRGVGRDDLPPGQYSLLLLMKENPGVRQTALSRAVGRDKSTLTPALANMEREGLLRREQSPV